jgi:hypothetical protein
MKIMNKVLAVLVMASAMTAFGTAAFADGVGQNNASDDCAQKSGKVEKARKAGDAAPAPDRKADDAKAGKAE